MGNPPGERLDDVVSASLAVQYQTLWEAVQIVGEISGETNKNPDRSGIVSLLGGVTYRFTPSLTADLAMRGGVTGDSSDFSIALGFSSTF